MSIVSLILGQLLPWLIGTAWLAGLGRTNAAGRPAVIAGYGYLVGSFALTLWMRALSAAHVPFGRTTIALPLLLSAALALWWGRRRGTLAFSGARNARASTMPRRWMILWWLLAALIVIHFALDTLEIVWRPLFPWDAWSQWATKARVWYELGAIAPFSDVQHWLAGGSYIDTAPNYPGTVPLLQVWASIALGHWDDSLMNLPWVSFALALALCVYGQSRSIGFHPLLAMAGAYFVASLPMVDTHTALAGYADLPLATYYSAAAIALWQWSITRERAQATLALLLAAACPLTKLPGWVWLATLLPALLVAWWPQRGLRAVYALWGAGAITVLVLAQYQFQIGGYTLHATLKPVWEPLWQNYYEFANWHLLGYALPLLAAFNFRRLLHPPLVAGSVMVASGAAFLFVVFSLTSAELWVRDFSTVNRATLHFAPLLIFYVIALTQGSLQALRDAAPETSAPASSA